MSKLKYTCSESIIWRDPVNDPPPSHQKCILCFWEDELFEGKRHMISMEGYWDKGYDCWIIRHGRTVKEPPVGWTPLPAGRDPSICAPPTMEFALEHCKQNMGEFSHRDLELFARTFKLGQGIYHEL